MKLSHTLLVTALLSASGQLFAAEEREDYDLDDNGLIEINSLQDLDAMRHYRETESEFNLSTAAGCPESGCTGFELTTDLNFDTNNDGVINASDEFWNDGAGWEPVGGSPTFGATFNGNNHVIRNLYINRPETDNVGLFGLVYWGNIYNLAIAGSLTSVTGQDNVGILIGRITRGDVSSVSTSGQVQGGNHVGGLIGDYRIEANDRRNLSSCYSTADVNASGAGAGGIAGYVNSNNVTECFAMGDVTANTKAGGLIGGVTSMSIANTYASGNVSATDMAGGLVGSHDSYALNIYYSYAMGNVSASDSEGVAGGLIGQANNSSVNKSHWTTETGQQYLHGGGTLQNDEGNSSYSQSVLSCPTAANDTDCTTDATLYQDWTNNYTLDDETVVNYWDFGTASQMPVLTAQGYVLRDRDGDGIWDFNDAYPDDPSNTEPSSPGDGKSGGNSGDSSGGGSLAWLLALASLMTLRRKSI